MKKPFKIKTIAFAISLLLNLCVAVPAIAVFFLSSAVRLILHDQAASRLGDPDIVFIGDSITRDGGIWEMRIGQPLFKVRNLGQSGFLTGQMFGQAYEAGSVNAKTAFIMAGINDANQPDNSVENTFLAYVQMVEILQSKGVVPVIQSTLYTEREEHREFVTELNSSLRSFANDNEIDFMDLNELLASESRLKPEFSRDGVHLTENAYAIWSERVREFLAQQK